MEQVLGGLFSLCKLAAWVKLSSINRLREQESHRIDQTLPNTSRHAEGSEWWRSIAVPGQRTRNSSSDSITVSTAAPFSSTQDELGVTEICRKGASQDVFTEHVDEPVVELPQQDQVEAFAAVKTQYAESLYGSKVGLPSYPTMIAAEQL